MGCGVFKAAMPTTAACAGGCDAAAATHKQHEWNVEWCGSRPLCIPAATGSRGCVVLLLLLLNSSVVRLIVYVEIVQCMSRVVGQRIFMVNA